jgi:hypothetical protein
MKKLVLAICVIILFNNFINAQVQILYANTPFAAGTVHQFNASLTGFKVPKADSAQVWNYSSLQPLNSADTTLTALSLSFKASHLGVISGFDRFRENIASTTVVRSTQVFDKDTGGIFLAGNVLFIQKFSLYNYFGNHKDSLFIPLDNEYFRINRITFPTKIHSAYKTRALKVLKFNITIDTLKLYKAPGTKNTIYKVKDTVAGEGTLRIPAPDKYSVPYKVLLIKRRTEATDSFYINNSPGNPILLQALGIQQGKRTVDYKEFFYRAGSPDPLLTISYGIDSTYTLPISVLYSSDSIKSNIAKTTTQASEFKIFPNPASSGFVHANILKNSFSHWTISFYNGLGQEILDKTISDSGNLDLDFELPNQEGLYIVALKDETGSLISMKKVLISKR